MQRTGALFAVAQQAAAVEPLIAEFCPASAPTAGPHPTAPAEPVSLAIAQAIRQTRQDRLLDRSRPGFRIQRKLPVEGDGWLGNHPRQAAAMRPRRRVDEEVMAQEHIPRPPGGIGSPTVRACRRGLLCRLGPVEPTAAWREDRRDIEMRAVPSAVNLVAGLDVPASVAGIGLAGEAHGDRPADVRTRPPPLRVPPPHCPGPPPHCPGPSSTPVRVPPPHRPGPDVARKREAIYLESGDRYQVTANEGASRDVHTTPQ